jgi:hypothetical protein
MATPLKSFHIDQRLRNLSDPLKSWNFELSFSNISNIVSTVSDDEPLIIRCRSASIPSRGNDVMETYFLGMKQVFPGRPTFDNTLNITFEEYEDMLITKTLSEWQNKIFDTNLNSGTAGTAQATGKREGIAGTPYSTIAHLTLYKTHGLDAGVGNPTDKQIKFVNIWPSSKPAIDLNYTASDTVKYNVTFSFDYWELI